MTAQQAIQEALLAADRVDSRSTLADDGEGYWVSLREMQALRSALAHRTVKRLLDEYAPSLLKPRPKRRSGGIKRTVADDRWSKAVRARDDYTCQFPGCGRRYPDNIGQVDAAHCFGRRCGVCTGSRYGWKKPHDCTRLDPANGLTMCRPHHQYIDSHTTEKYELFRSVLGDEAFDALSARAHAKRDRKVAS